MSIPPAFPSDQTPSLRARLLRQLRFGDYLIAALFLAFAIASVTWNNLSRASAKADTAQVLVQNKIVAELNLEHADTVAVQGTLGAVQLAVAHGTIRVLASSCPQQVCVRQGRIQRAHQMLVCAPNHLAVVLVGKKENDLDAVTF